MIRDLQYADCIDPHRYAPKKTAFAARQARASREQAMADFKAAWERGP
jgi:hypothetical protein